ncbi:MAG TPA: tetratricopeptide repeat protein [Gemmatales bacterium]|nr:tetratricopeptide repeat protein [Gemmatales bacterium]
MPIDPKRVQAVFLAAVEQTERSARAAVLDHECSGDNELRRRVEALLRANDEPGSYLDQPAVGLPDKQAATEATTGFEATQSYTSADPTPGVVIAGRYTLEQKIGEGGMGEVWVAKQSEPVKRKVALKLIKAGMDSKSVVQRFEQERQALAMMDHPNIAKVLDGGLNADRRPFFVMELVNGLPLTKFCDETKLGIKERLELFIPICQAVQHAHQKGIVHRDLKPSNILVTMIDGKPVPKVIDFGVAKATSGRLTEDSLSTQFGAVVGTLEYMSPEQAEFSGDDIDTRADIYSLGVILYELLTGLRPIDSKRLKKAALTEMIRIIQKEEPSKPSRRLSTDASLPSMAAIRQIDPRKLTNLLRGELDWVVMKCLEKQRDRRYETANGLARDIQRYLADEVVEARPPSLAYKLRKFALRNKVKVIAAGLVFCTLLAGVLGTLAGLLEARRQADAKELARQDEARQRALAEQREREAVGERQKAEVAREQEIVAKNDAVAKRREAEINLGYARKGNEILSSIFTGLDTKTQYAEVGEFRLALSNNLLKAVRELEGSSIGDPLVVAEMQMNLGESLLALGEANLAIEVLEKAHHTREAKLGLDHPDTLASMHSQAMSYSLSGNLDKAVALLEQTLKLRTAKLGPDHHETINTMYSLAISYGEKGNLNQALALLEQTWKMQKSKLGENHVKTLTTMNSLGTAYGKIGRLDEAHTLLEQTLKLMRTNLGTDHPETLRCMKNLAGSYNVVRKLDLAIPLMEQILKHQTANLGANHPSTLSTLTSLADGYRTVGKLEQALPLLEQSLKVQTMKLGSDHPETLRSINNLGGLYYSTGKTDQAIPLLEKAYYLRKAKLGAEHPDTLTSMNNLAGIYQVSGKPELALPLVKQSLELRTAKLGQDHPDTLTSLNNLAMVYREAGKLDEALPLMEQTVKRRTAKLGATHPDTLSSLANLGVILLRQKKGIEAEGIFREHLALRLKTNPSDWTTFDAYSLLGDSLLTQKKYAEAESNLLKSYQGLKEQINSIPKRYIIRVSDTLDRMIQLYSEIDKADEVKKWQAERAKYPKAKDLPPKPK